MEYIKTTNSDFIEIMRQVHQYTNSGKEVKKVLDFIENNKSILDSDEYYNVEKYFPETRPGVMAFMIMEEKYNINIRKMTFVILLYLLGQNIPNDIVSLATQISGLSLIPITKIKNDEKCILIDIKLHKSKSLESLNYFQLECVQNDIICKYRKDGKCNRSTEEIQRLLGDLKANDIIKVHSGKYCLTF